MDWTGTLRAYGVNEALVPMYEIACWEYGEAEVEEVVVNWDEVHGCLPTPGELSRLLEVCATPVAAASAQQPCYSHQRRHEG